MNLTSFLASCPPGDGVPWARCATCDAPLRSDGLGCTGAVRHVSTGSAATVTLYATWTGTRQNLHAMHANGIRLIVGPDQLDRMRGQPPLSWALDNGAYGCFTRGERFDGAAFRVALDRYGRGADWIVCPDLVGGGLRSLEMSLDWLDRVQELGRPVYLAVQDGMTVEDVRPLLHHGHGDAGPGKFSGIFVGGSTEWKLSTMHAWGRLACSALCNMHVGRVNSAKRLRAAIDAGADSVDGTSVTRFSVNAAPLAAAAAGPRHPTFGF